MRPTPPRRSPARAPEEELASRRRRAVEETLDVRLRAREPFVVLEVHNPIHRTRYRVLFPEYPGRGAAFCGCTDFARRGLGTCKHVEAGWSWLHEQAELPEVPPTTAPGPAAGDVWKEVDRRLEGLRATGPGEIRDVERAGAALFEEPGTYERTDRESGEEVGRPRARRPPTTTSRARP